MVSMVPVTRVSDFEMDREANGKGRLYLPHPICDQSVMITIHGVRAPCE